MRSNSSWAGRLAARVISLFPGAWRQRYGDELQVLIEERTVTFGDVWDVLRTALLERSRQVSTPGVSRSAVDLLLAALAGVLALRAAAVAVAVFYLIASIVWDGISHLPGDFLSRWEGHVVHDVLLQPMTMDSVIVGYSLLFGAPVVALLALSGLSGVAPRLARSIGVIAIMAFALWTGNWLWIASAATCGWVLTTLWFRHAKPNGGGSAVAFGARA
jgi:hypothetical protein